MTPETGSSRAHASPQPAGRPLTSTTRTPPATSFSIAPSADEVSLPAVVSVPSTSVNTASTPLRSAWRSGCISVELQVGQKPGEDLRGDGELLGGGRLLARLAQKRVEIRRAPVQRLRRLQRGGERRHRLAGVAGGQAHHALQLHSA